MKIWQHIFTIYLYSEGSTEYPDIEEKLQRLWNRGLTGFILVFLKTEKLKSFRFPIDNRNFSGTFLVRDWA